MKLRLAGDCTINSEVNRIGVHSNRMLETTCLNFAGNGIKKLLFLIFVIGSILLLVACSNNPTDSTTPSQDPVTETEEDSDTEMFLDWPDPSVFKGTFSFNPSTYESRPVELPDLDAILNSLSWDEWEATNNPVVVVHAIAGLLFDNMRIESSQNQLFSLLSNNSTNYVYEFHEPIAREDLHSTARMARDSDSVQLSADWNRHLCWDPGIHEQRSGVISQTIEFEWSSNGATQNLILEISVTIVVFTNGDFQLEIEVTLEGHGGKMSSGRWTDDGLLNEVGDYTETLERSGGYDRQNIEFDDGSSGQFWCPTGSCSGDYADAIQDILSNTWNDLAHGDTRLLDFAVLQVLVGLEDSGYEPVAGGSDFCLDVTVDPDFARLDPDGDQVDLTTTILDWYERPIHGAIVSYDNIQLGSISLQIAPTNEEGERTSTYTSDETGVENVHVITGYSFYTDTSYAELQIGDELNLHFWAGKDPDQFGGDNMGALAGAISGSEYGTSYRKENQPPDLPMLSDASCGFFTEGFHLIGSQQFAASGTAGGQTATAVFSSSKQTDNGNRVALNFEGEAVATAVNEIGTWAEAASEEVDEFVHQPAILVFEVDNPQADSLILTFTWNVSGSLGGEPDYSQWWADAFYRVRSCGDDDGGPSSHWQLLFSFDDEFPGSGPGNQEILLVEERSQVHLMFEAGALANAVIPPGDEPPVESWASVSASLQADLQSYFSPDMIAARRQGQLDNFQSFSVYSRSSGIESRLMHDTNVTLQTLQDNIYRNIRLRDRTLVRESFQ
jgi:hypothetical protein